MRPDPISFCDPISFFLVKLVIRNTGGVGPRNQIIEEIYEMSERGGGTFLAQTVDIRNSGINVFFPVADLVHSTMGETHGKALSRNPPGYHRAKDADSAMSAIKQMLGKLFGYVLLAGILFGLFTIVVVPIEMAKMAAAEKWPSRKGLITKSFADRHSSNRRAPWWRAEICGTYVDSEEKFYVRRVRYGDFRFGSGETAAREAVAKYPVGREVDIYYSPSNPKETVLEARTSWNTMVTLLGLGIGFLLLPVLLWLFRRQLEPERYK